MKKIIYLFIILLSAIILTSCNYEYNGKEITSIEYVSINYMGGYRREHKIDLGSNVVLFRGYLPDEEEQIPEFKILYTFNDVDENAFINELNKAGFFDLDDNYPSPGNIMDGGGWQLNINYLDNSVKTSKGDNNSPERVFKKADYAFYNLYGEDMFGTLPSGYKYPPSIDIAYGYGYDKTQVSDGSSLSSTNATWNKYKKEGIDNIEHALHSQRFTFSENFDYTFSLWTANLKYKFSNLVIKSYDLDGNDEELIINTKWFKQKEFEIVFDRVYVITIKYPQGICEYTFATKLNFPKEMPLDFNFSVSWGYDGKYDSSTKVLSNGYNYDLQKECKTELELSNEELKEIFDIIRKSNLHVQKNANIRTKNYDEDPSADLKISFSYNIENYNIKLENAYLNDNMDEYINGKAQGKAIKEIIEGYILNSAEFKSLPENQKLYD